MSAAAPVIDNRLRTPLAQQFERVPADWRGVTDAFARSEIGRSLIEFVDGRVREGAIVYPSTPFRALELTPAHAVRVVIVGQDPYHGPGQAQGLAFSVAPGHRPPPSLRNMLVEVQNDTGAPSICRDDLTAWAQQGVLLLNTALTVEDGAPQSHAKRGWEVLTDALISHVARGSEPVVFMLWGGPAQRKRELIDTDRHFVLTANHPSPLSARRPPEPFIGCRHYTRANAALATLRPGTEPIRW